MSSKATVVVDGVTVASFEVPKENMGQPSAQCAWLRDRVNDALTSELTKFQQEHPSSASAAASKKKGKKADEADDDSSPQEEDADDAM